MSELKTNKISTNDQNNVAIDNALGLKSYTEAQRDALTASAGDMIYNTTLGVPQYYDGSAWNSMKDFVNINTHYLVIAGGGGTGNSFASAMSACKANHIPTIVAINAAIPPKVFKLTCTLVSSLNSFAIFF